MTVKLGTNPIAGTNDDMPAELDPAKAHPLTYAKKATPPSRPRPSRSA
jgi:hypothetical protein